VTQDIDSVLQDWEYEPGTIQARLIEAADGRQVIQMRVELGVLQLERLGRPDGTRPHGFPTFFDYLQQKARMDKQGGESFVLSEDQCQEADREFMQFYQRRICWLALQNYIRALADADHTLSFMDFVRDHSPDDGYTQAHEQYRGFVVFQRTQAAAALRLEKNDPEGAIDEIHTGLARMKEFFTTYDADDSMEDNPMVQHLRKIEETLREQHGIEATLQERLAKAVANEQYEEAARLRDALRRQKGKKKKT
jgi:hypothetical protein